MIRLLTIYLFSVISLLSSAGEPIVIRDIRSMGGTESPKFTMDSIVLTDVYARIYGKLSGHPHTSCRIDEIELKGCSTESTVSNDIDGIDYRRWFQWEDDGTIPLEIDFPPSVILSDTFIIEAKTPRGMVQWKFSHGTD